MNASASGISVKVIGSNFNGVLYALRIGCLWRGIDNTIENGILSMFGSTNGQTGCLGYFFRKLDWPWFWLWLAIYIVDITIIGIIAKQLVKKGDGKEAFDWSSGSFTSKVPMLRRPLAFEMKWDEGIHLFLAICRFIGLNTRDLGCVWADSFEQKIGGQFYWGLGWHRTQGGWKNTSEVILQNLMSYIIPC